MKKYLLAVDGSDNSRRAADFAVDLIRDNKSDITLIHVVNVKKEFNRYPLTDVREIERMAMDNGRQLLDEQAGVFEREGIGVDKVVAQGDPGVKIAEFGAEGGFTQIIIGTRGLSDLKGLVLGSVSHKVIHFAQCPVTLVK